MKRLVLYPERSYPGQDCSEWKKEVVPNQSMKLQEIIRRFVRRETLPTEHKGVYHEGEYDLEKLAKADVVEQLEVLDRVKRDVVRKKKVLDDFRKAEDEIRAKGSEPAKKPGGEPEVKPPDPKGP